MMEAYEIVRNIALFHCMLWGVLFLLLGIVALATELEQKKYTRLAIVFGMLLLVHHVVFSIAVAYAPFGDSRCPCSCAADNLEE